MWLLGLYCKKVICCLSGYNIPPVEIYSNGATCFERFELKIYQISLTAANLCVSHSCGFSCGLLKQIMPLRNLKELFDIIAPKTKWLSFENILSVIRRFTPSIPLKYINPNNASISTLSVFFDPCALAWFIEVVTSLQTCYSFIYPSVCAVKNFVHDIIIKV